MAEAENPVGQKSQDEAEHPPCQGHSSEYRSLPEKPWICTLVYWFCFATCWQDFFNATDSTKCSKKKSFLNVLTGTTNFLEVTKDQIRLTLIIERILLKFHSNTGEKASYESRVFKSQLCYLTHGKITSLL